MSETQIQSLAFRQAHLKSERLRLLIVLATIGIGFLLRSVRVLIHSGDENVQLWLTTLSLLAPFAGAVIVLFGLHLIGWLGRVPERGNDLAAMAAKRRSIFPSFGAALASYKGRGAFKTWPDETVADYLATHGYYGKRTAFNLALPNQGQTIPTELPRPGAVRVDCDAHGWMEAWIYVVDNPYYAVTGADGKFSITAVPPGDYKLVAVQPFTGPMEMPVTVAGGAPTTLDIELKKQ